MIRVERHGTVTFVRLARGLLGRGIYWTGCYVADGVLIDCGPPATVDELLAAVDPRRLAGLAITHHHEDHMGAAPALYARHGLQARAHALSLPLLERGYEQQPYRRLAWGRPGRVSGLPLGESFGGERLRFDVIATPGHSPDHVCLLVPERGWLFTGDLFLAERLRFLRADEGLGLLIESLERVARLPVGEVFCAHRGPVHGGVQALARKADRLRSLREAIWDGLARGEDEAHITRRLVGREGFLSLLSWGHFAARNFVRVARLERDAQAGRPSAP